ncbi:unnamed protein product [Rodentolepis nana]|uniref:Inosine triphosphate pyrophosphatase n=1 Tax=Rodentolepis nana TaxID=102285 RepID=A0A0R3SZX0_RODNA|nr:unnamed protein product [Rodentolepis nana]
MPEIVCGRIGCRFPIKSDRIICSLCSANFHPSCSNLTPEEFGKESNSGNWRCSKCPCSTYANSSNDASPKRVIADSIFPISYVTGNPNKLRETIAVLGNEYAQLIKQHDADLPEYQGSSPEEIAVLKCRHAANLVDGPVLIEDTCLAFDALKGLPGPYIKWFIKAVGPDGLNKMLEGFRDGMPGGDYASAICTFAYTSGRGPEAEVKVLQGITRGRIVKPRGKSGFGFDPCFEPLDSQGLTYAELGSEEKNRISHRFKAVEKLKVLLNELSETR